MRERTHGNYATYLRIVIALACCLGGLVTQATTYNLRITNPGFETVNTWYQNYLSANWRTEYNPNGNYVSGQSIFCSNYGQVIAGWSQYPSALTGSLQGTTYPTSGTWGITARTGTNTFYFYTTGHIGYWQGIYQVLPDLFMAGNYSMMAYAGKNLSPWGGAEIKLGVQLTDGTVQWLASTYSGTPPANGAYKQLTASYTYTAAQASLLGRPMVVYLGSCFMDGWTFFDDVSATVTPVAVTAEYTIDDFEGLYQSTLGGSSGDAGGSGMASISTAQAHTGSKSLKFDYNFTGFSLPTPPYVYARAVVRTPVPQRPTTFKIWVYGTTANAGMNLNYRFTDTTGRTWQGSLGTINWTGWQQRTGAFDPTLTHWGGSDTYEGGQLSFAYPISFAEFTLAGGSSGNPLVNQIYLDDFTVTGPLYEDTAVTVTHSSTWPGGIGVGTDPGASIQVHNLFPATRQFQLAYNLYDGKGALAASGTTNVSAAANQMVNVPLSLTLHRGFYTLNTTLTEPGFAGLSIPRNFTLASVPSVPSGVQSSSMMGQNGHQDASGIKPLGGAIVRGDFVWPGIEPQQGSFLWDATDAFVDQAEANGLEVLGALGYNPSWVTIPTTPAGLGTDNTAFLNYVTQVVTRYQGRVKYWSIWNEPNGLWPGWPQRFGQLAWDAYCVIKQIDPNATVLYTGTDDYDFENDIYWTKASLEYLVPTFPFDVLEFHAYPRPSSPEAGALREDLQYVKSWQNSATGASGKPIWLTEIGWPTGDPSDGWSVSETLQAAYLVRSYAIALGEGVQKVCWYQIGENHSITGPEGHFGICYPDASPKPAAAAYAQVAYRLGAGVTLDRIINKGTSYRVYVFQSSTQVIAVVWTLGLVRGFQSSSWPTTMTVEDYDGAPMTRTAKLRTEDRPIYLTVPIANKTAFINALNGATFTTWP